MGKPKLTDESIEYMKQWAQCDQHDDIQAFFEEGEYELVAVRLAGSGCVEENNNACERNINLVAKSITYRSERIRINRCLKGYTVWTCEACNACLFISKYDDWEAGYHCPSCSATNQYTVEEWDTKPKKD